MSIDHFIFENDTKIYFGKDQLGNLPSEIRKYGNKVLLTYGGGSVKRIGLLDKVKSILEADGITVKEFGGIEPNPRHTTVNAGAEICRKERIDVLLAVGGGSTIDCTKAIAAATYYEGDAWDLMSCRAPITDALPIITILTLSATGSEMNAGSVISNIGTNEKFGLLHPLFQPKASFLDPTNTYTVNAYQTASGSADIIAHIFDISYFVRGKKMEMLDLMMEALMKTVVKYTPIALREPDNYEARANLMWASTWALNRFLMDGTEQSPACHFIEHELSAFYDITHGHGLAIIMPRWLEYILNDTTAPDIKKFGVNVFGLDASASNIDGAKAAIERLKTFLFDELGLQSRLSDLNIDRTHFKTMAKKACFGEVMYGYTDLTPDDVEKILEMSL